jgi:SET domain-containing protein
VLIPRQGLGASQFTSDSIMIVGGFGGKYFDESLIFNTDSNTVVHTPYPPPQNIFPFAVPTIGNIEKQELITIDWTTFIVLSYANGKWNRVAQLKKP